MAFNIISVFVMTIALYLYLFLCFFPPWPFAILLVNSVCPIQDCFLLFYFFYLFIEVCLLSNEGDSERV